MHKKFNYTCRKQLQKINFQKNKKIQLIFSLKIKKKLFIEKDLFRNSLRNIEIVQSIFYFCFLFFKYFELLNVSVKTTDMKTNEAIYIHIYIHIHTMCFLIDFIKIRVFLID